MVREVEKANFLKRGNPVHIFREKHLKILDWPKINWGVILLADKITGQKETCSTFSLQNLHIRIFSPYYKTVEVPVESYYLSEIYANVLQILIEKCDSLNSHV